MAQSVKLKDGSYIDTEGIYDVTQGKTQKDVNAEDKFKIIYRSKSSSRSFTFKTTEDTFFIISRQGVWNSVNGSLASVARTIETATYSLSRALDADGVTYIYTFNRTDGSDLIYGGIVVFW